MLNSNSRSLVEIVENVRREEPVLITSEVEEFLPSCSNLSYFAFTRFDKDTRDIERSHLDNDDLREVYARRLLAGFYFSQEVDSRSCAYRDAIFAYDRAGRAAKILTNSTGDDAKFWMFRSALTRLSSGRLNESGGFYEDAFFTYLFVAESALWLIDYEGDLDILGLTRERAFDIFVGAFGKMKGFSNERFLTGAKVSEIYRRVISGYERVIAQPQRLHA